MTISRRDFFKLSGLALGAAWLPPLPHDEGPRRPVLLGRTIHLNYVFDRPSLSAQHVGIIQAGSVFNIYSTVQSADKHYNRTWYEAQQGFVHSASVQPVRWQLQEPILNLPLKGFLGEVTVPVTAAQTGPGAHYNTAFSYFYSTTYWITGVKLDDAGTVWYQALDDRYQKNYWVRADHIRRVSDVEMSPIAPEVIDKRIEVDLANQIFRCYQSGQLVLETLCSTGPYLRTENGKRIYGTPAGNLSIIRKRPTRHMAGDDRASSDFFDLPGVPWVSYFHWWGVSIHGTYWHNDYGRPRSHGCVNLSPEAAKWVFRWSLPQASIEQDETRAPGGTSMIVF